MVDSRATQDLDFAPRGLRALGSRSLSFFPQVRGTLTKGSIRGLCAKFLRILASALNMNKENIITQWSRAVDSGSFLTAKHDPAGLAIGWATFRTVLSAEASTSLDSYIKSGHYGIHVFEDRNFPSSSGFFEIVPSGSYPFSVAGSGVQSGSVTPSGSYDRLVVAHTKK